MSDILASLGQRKSPNDPPLRQGKWTREEEEYVHCLIDEFKTGMMPLAEGTSLRTFLSKMLNCHPMRISKKFVGSNYNGKQVYARRTGSDRLSNDEVKARRAKLCDLERKFLAKIAPKNATASRGQPSLQQPKPPSLAAPQLQDGISRVSTSGVDLRNLINQAAQSNGGANADLSRNISLLDMPLNNNGNSSHSLQNLFQDLVTNNSTGSLEAFSMMMQHHQQQQQQQQGGSNSFGGSQSSSTKSNSRAAAAGRALLQSGLGLDKKPSPGVASTKPLADFTSAELAAELRKRSSLKDLVAQLGGGGGTSSSSNNNQSNNNFGQSLANLQGSLQQAADASNANAFSSLIRNSSIDMSNLIERQGSIDSLSNLAIRSRLQSIQSMGSLLDPLLEGGNFGGSSGGNNNSNWTPSTANLNINNLAAKVSTESFGGSQPRTANDFMESLGVSRASLSNLASTTAAGTSGSGVNLASLLNNEDALRRLEATAPSSLNFNFQDNNDSSGRLKSLSQPDQSQSDDNTAIAQFLLQKKLLEGNNSSSRKDNPSNEQQQLMMNVAAGGGGGGGVDPIMSSLLSSLRSNGDLGSSQQQQQQQQQQQHDELEALKRKFFGSQDMMDQHRRNKPFR